MRKKEQLVLPQISFIDAGAKGTTLGKAADGRMVMVNNAIPGDIADVKVLKKKKNYYQGTAINFTTFSKDRVEPKCEHFGLCGGCKWQNMSYEKQVFYKQREVVNNFTKIAQIVDYELHPILESEKHYHYRNKMEFSFSDQRWLSEEEIQSQKEIEDKNALGFHLPGMWSKILNLNHCYLQAHPSDEMRNFIKEKSESLGIPYFNPKEQTGILRNVMFRNNSLNEWMLVFQITKNFKQKEEFFDSILSQFPEISTLCYTINDKRNDSIYDLDIQTYFGEGYIWENLEDLRFKITPKSFFQTNTEQALKLYKLTREYANLQSDEIVYDLYTGTGTIAQFVSKNAKKVIGIESVPEAIEAAKENAHTNNIDNCEFFTGDMKTIFNADFVKENGHPDVIITDPPRDGMHQKVVENILFLEPKKIVYVSCNSATQARDIALLKEKYAVSIIHPVDMFPQTHHVENIAVLNLIKS